MKPYQGFLAVLALCVAISVSAQTSTVTGIVIDNRPEKPIKGVAVYAENQRLWT